MYQALLVYDLESNFIGYVLKDNAADKLQSTNIWREDETEDCRKRLDELNRHVNLSKHWPHPQDPDVVALLNDPKFEPIELMETEVIDEDNSFYVWKKRAGDNPGEWIDSDELDQEASVLVYKKAMVPRRPTDVMQRIKVASERVAKQRAGLL